MLLLLGLNVATGTVIAVAVDFIAAAVNNLARTEVAGPFIPVSYCFCQHYFCFSSPALYIFPFTVHAFSTVITNTSIADKFTSLTCLPHSAVTLLLLLNFISCATSAAVIFAVSIGYVGYCFCCS